MCVCARARDNLMHTFKDCVSAQGQCALGALSTHYYYYHFQKTDTDGKRSHLTDGVVVVELADEGVPVVLVVVDAVVAVLLDVDDEPVRRRSRRGVRHLH